MIPSFVEKTRVPKKPGVYIFKDKTGRVLYVGKAINLYNRVSSYFSKVITARKKELEGAEKYWGPFPSARTVRDTLKSLRRIFPWCSQKKLFAVSRSLLAANSQKLIANSYKPCFYYHL